MIHYPTPTNSFKSPPVQTLPKQHSCLCLSFPKMARIKPEPGSNCFIPRPKSRCTLRDSKSPNFNKPSASTKATTTLKNDGIKIENNDKTAPSLPPKKRRGRDNYDENREIILSTPRNISRPVSPVLGSGRDSGFRAPGHRHAYYLKHPGRAKSSYSDGRCWS